MTGSLGGAVAQAQLQNRLFRPREAHLGKILRHFACPHFGLHDVDEDYPPTAKQFLSDFSSTFKVALLPLWA
ncbi:hypothetical protein HMPREF3198_00893 [Winkia neuii]|nr:hypothetical protein HMPREF3198_00893 [Winkia neuii]